MKPDCKTWLASRIPPAPMWLKFQNFLIITYWLDMCQIPSSTRPCLMIIRSGPLTMWFFMNSSVKANELKRKFCSAITKWNWKTLIGSSGTMYKLWATTSSLLPQSTPQAYAQSIQQFTSSANLDSPIALSSMNESSTQFLIWLVTWEVSEDSWTTFS